MALTLVLEASGRTAHVAVIDGTTCLAEGRTAMRQRDRDALLPLILELCEQAAVTPSAFAALAIGDGPGSFTSLRVAAATAKGLVHGTSASLVAVPSLVLVAASLGGDVPRLVHADALRGERFVQLVHPTPEGWAAEGPVRLMASTTVAAFAETHGATPLDADGADGRFASAYPRLRADQRTIVNVATWEPAYGRLAEAQVKWEAASGRALPAAPLGAIG